jgi:urate oxidase/2-oxo-4-hydroxy-4-carboxy-5-ureidoimidazoline decarboxylase
MNTFTTGPKRNYYGKGDVIVYKLHRAGQPGRAPFFGANVKMLLYGDAFWTTYTTGDNTNLIATDSMKNFIQRETMNFEGSDLESYCHFLATKFLGLYRHTEGIQVSAIEIPYSDIGGSISFAPSGPFKATAQIELGQSGIADVRSGIKGFQLLRLGGSAFRGFVRDEYTTLPEIKNRPLHMWLDLEWSYTESAAAFTNGEVTRSLRNLIYQTYQSFESGSIQQIIYLIGTKILESQSSIAEVHLEANNRTWDTIVEQGEEVGVYSDARPPYGILGLTLKR